MQPVSPFFILMGIANEGFVFKGLGHVGGSRNDETQRKTADQENCFIEEDR